MIKDAIASIARNLLGPKLSELYRFQLSARSLSEVALLSFTRISVRAIPNKNGGVQISTPPNAAMDDFMLRSCFEIAT